MIRSTVLVIGHEVLPFCVVYRYLCSHPGRE